MERCILIADDSRMARMFLRRSIEATGLGPYEIIEAEDGQVALDILQERAVDLVITDLIMPEMDGETLLAEIKNDPALEEMMVIVVSSATNPSKRARLTLAGALAVLEKPVNPAELAQALQEAEEDDDFDGGGGW